MCHVSTNEHLKIHIFSRPNLSKICLEHLHNNTLWVMYYAIRREVVKGFGQRNDFRVVRFCILAGSCSERREETGSEVNKRAQAKYLVSCSAVLQSWQFLLQTNAGGVSFYLLTSQRPRYVHLTASPAHRHDEQAEFPTSFKQTSNRLWQYTFPLWFQGGHNMMGNI